MITTGCNSGSGEAEVRTTTISFGDLALTQMACAGGAAITERAMLEVLGADVVAYSIEASTLELSIGDAGLLLTGSALE